MREEVKREVAKLPSGRGTGGQVAQILVSEEVSESPGGQNGQVTEGPGGPGGSTGHGTGGPGGSEGSTGHGTGGPEGETRGKRERSADKDYFQAIQNSVPNRSDCARRPKKTG